jgi:hypothetical protein
MLLQSEPPQNGQFMVAAYTLVAVVLLVYAVTLFVRARRIMAEVKE